MTPGSQVNHLNTGKASAPPSQGAPPPYSPQSGELGTRQVKNVMHLRNL